MGQRHLSGTSAVQIPRGATSREEQDLSGPIRGAWPKLRAIAGRLTLIVHLLRFAAGEDVDPLAADAESVRRAVILTDWFGYEASRVYAMRGESNADRDERKLIEWIEAQGGRGDARQGPGGLPVAAGPRAG